VYKKLLKIPNRFGKNVGGFFLTHTIYFRWCAKTRRNPRNCCRDIEMTNTEVSSCFTTLAQSGKLVRSVYSILAYASYYTVTSLPSQPTQLAPRTRGATSPVKRSNKKFW